MNKTSELIWQDEQHQDPFRIIKLLKGPDGSHALEKLTDYIDYHFSLEEKYMARLKYPDMEVHIQTHRKFADLIKSYTVDRPIFDEQFANELSENLSEWLTKHVYGIDKKFEEFVLSSSYK